MDFSMFDNIRFEPEMRKHEPNDMPNMMSRPRFPEHTPLAMAYVPLQQWGQTYDEKRRLKEVLFSLNWIFHWLLRRDVYEF